jgi:hypothetical protein
MKRRTFTKLTAAPPALRGTPTATSSATQMKPGTHNDSKDVVLRVLAAPGINHLCGTLPSPRFDDQNWSVAGRTRLRERVEITASSWTWFRFRSARIT